MRVIKCDRCGSIYKNNDPKRLLIYRKINERPLDICGECDKRIREFLDNKIESENDVSDRNVGDMGRVTNEHNQDS